MANAEDLLILNVTQERTAQQMMKRELIVILEMAKLLEKPTSKIRVLVSKAAPTAVKVRRKAASTS